MKQILCPTDFSTAAQNAIAYAAKLAQITGARLVLLNVQAASAHLAHQEMVMDGEAGPRPIADVLEAQSLEVSKAFHISCYAEVQYSSVSLARAIADNAAGYSLVVMGTNGPDDIYQFLTGSNAYKACIKSSVPVLLIPETCSYSEIKTVVYAFDYLSSRKLPLDQLKPFVKALKCKLSILQVMEEAYSEEFENELRELQFISKALHADDVKLTFDTLRSYEIAEAIHGYVLKSQPDILALCAVHRSLLERLFHRSLIKHFSSASTYPIFIFHQ